MKIKIENLTKRFHDQVAVNQFNATIESGELVALLGPSGCGKSTMLNMLSGILTPSEGKIFFDDVDVTEVAAEKRGVGLVFQNYALYPHMTVLQNICFPLEIQKIEKVERLRRALEVAKLVHVDHLMQRKPGQLSGGQQQRVAIARALVKNPKVLLLDEPLSNLDARLRIEMREEIRRIQQETQVTTIFVTHDQEEAMSISDKIIIMKDGYLQQMDRPQECYDNPLNCFVADFLGNPPINKLPATIKNQSIELADAQKVEGLPLPDLKEGNKVYLSIRSESMTLNNQAGIFCTIEQVSIMGKEKIITARCGNTSIRILMNTHATLDLDQPCYITLQKEGVFVFDEESGDRIL